MEDRELLEAAAKAVGYEFNGLWYGAQTGLLVWEPARGNFESRDWNPLTDCGDALRLACKLHINVLIYEDETSTATAGVVAKNWGSVEANTRRAIVRAAAAMCPREPPNVI